MREEKPWRHWADALGVPAGAWGAVEAVGLAEESREADREPFPPHSWLSLAPHPLHPGESDSCRGCGGCGKKEGDSG